MDRLPPETQESLKKTGTDRLTVKLGRAGVDEEEVLRMDRPELLEAVAKNLATEQLEVTSQAPPPTYETGSVASVGGRFGRFTGG